MLRHAETLKPDGTLNLANNGGMQATDTYTLRGTGSEEVWEPRFTFTVSVMSKSRAIPENRRWIQSKAGS